LSPPCVPFLSGPVRRATPGAGGPPVESRRATADEDSYMYILRFAANCFAGARTSLDGIPSRGLAQEGMRAGQGAGDQFKAPRMGPPWRPRLGVGAWAWM
jgi:hypothetical protein